MSHTQREPIAVVGMGCRFPGGANNPGAFWELLREGVDAIGDIPEERWESTRFFDPNPAAPGKLYIRQGGFIDQPIDEFDPQFFGISPREAAYMDPQQRLLLEVSWEAFEDAMLPPPQLEGSRTGVFVGAFTFDAMNIHLQAGRHNRRHISQHSHLGVTVSMIANRLSHVYDFRGPSITVDTACSSSLVALHLACQSLWNGECDQAIAGGVNIMLSPQVAIVMCKGGFLSPDARCRAFDADGKGYARGEGAGVLVLMPYKEACQRRLPVQALIRATGSNQDGRTPGVPVPRQASQESLMRGIYDSYGIDPKQIQYVEAHGTGTQVGDPIELNAIASVIGAGRTEACAIASVKTNIGHLEAASGVAGVIKTILSLKHKELPPHLHFKTPNPNVDWPSTGLRVPVEREPWPPHEGVAMAAVNSFGFGGSNAHVVLQAPPHIQRPELQEEGALLLLPISAHTSTALEELSSKYHEEESQKNTSLQELGASMAHGRTHLDCRRVFLCHTRQQWLDDLKRHREGEFLANVVEGKMLTNRKLVFVYTGMGPQWWGMGHELWKRAEVFRQTVKRCCESFAEHAGWSLLELLMEDPGRRCMQETRVAQPANVALQIGLAALWRELGIEPAALVGHSVGEVAAAYHAGALSLEDSMLISYHRSRLQQTLAGKGTMLAIGLQASEVAPLYEGLPVSLAAINSPRSVTLSGEQRALEEVSRRLPPNAFQRFLKVEVAYHSHQMEDIREQSFEAFSELEPTTPHTPLYSTVTCSRVEKAQHDAAYWWSNIRQPVHFCETMQAILDDGFCHFLEVGPHPVLAPSLRECISEKRVRGRCFATLNRRTPEWETFLKHTATLYVSGFPINWEFLYPEKRVFAPLPLVPWQREPYWVESHQSRQERVGKIQHPLLAQACDSPQPAWQCELNPLTFPFLEEHRVQAHPIFPAVGYIECALAIARRVFPTHQTISLEEVKFERALFLQKNEQEENLLLHTLYMPEKRQFEVHSQTASQEEAWSRHAKGRFIATATYHAHGDLDLEDRMSRLGDARDHHAVYEHLSSLGLEYGESFRHIQRLWHKKGEFLAEIDTTQLQRDGVWVFYPTLMDAAFQAMLIVTEGFEGFVPRNMLCLPVEVSHIRLIRPLTGKRIWSCGAVNSYSSQEFVGDLEVFDEKRELLLVAKGFRCQLLPTGASPAQNLLYHTKWENIGGRSLTPTEGSEQEAQGEWLLLGSRASTLALQKVLEENGKKSIVVETGKGKSGEERLHKERVQTMQELQSKGGFERIIYISGCADSVSAEDLVAACTQFVSWVQVLAEAGCLDEGSFGFVTSGAQGVTESEKVDPVQTALWSLCRVMAREYPSLDTRLLDVKEFAHRETAERVFEELSRSSGPAELVLRAGRWKRGTLRHMDLENNPRPEYLETRCDGDLPLRLERERKDGLSGLYFRRSTRRAPGDREVELQVYATALNFKDVMKAMGGLPERAYEGTFFGDKLGMECAGVVVRAGAQSTFSVGDEVVVCVGDCFRTYLTVDRRLVMHKPKNVGFEESLALIPFMTVLHGLRGMARLQKGERVLIHSASGGVGLAAVQYAQKVGAEIFATAGSEQKRELLRAMGIAYVMDSRALDFAEEVMKYTQGQGVDVILNSLSGEFLQKSLSVLSSYGRFIELGKRDIAEGSELSLKAFHRNLTFCAVDLDRMLAEKSEECLSLARELMREWESEGLHPLPTKVFSAGEVVEAFRYMAQAKHTGRIVLSFRSGDIPTREVAHTRSFQKDGTYLITGGLSGFGRELAKWLVEQGARHLVLVGRRGWKTPGVRLFVDELHVRHGVHCEVRAVDVADREQVGKMLREVRGTMPRLKGVFHAAMVLEDAPLKSLTAEQIEKVMAPKAKGAWILHELSLEDPLEHFVLFSSVSSLIGNRFQANYAAANGFLDGLSAMRSVEGRPSLSIQLGALADVGILAREQNVKTHLARIGLSAMPSDLVLSAMKLLLQHSKEALVGLFDLDWDVWADTHAKRPDRFAHLTQAGTHTRQEVASKGARVFQRQLRELDPAEQEGFVQQKLFGLLTEITQIPSEGLKTHRSLGQLGIDSLMVMELLTHLQQKWGIELSAARLLQGPTIEELLSWLSKELGL